MNKAQTPKTPKPIRCVVIYDGKFKSTSNGQPASFNMHYEGYVKRYLDVFDHVTLISRHYPEVDLTAKQTTGQGATFIPLPLFSNEINFTLNIPRFLWLFWKNLKKGEDVVLLRIPSLIGIFAALVCKLKGIPYAVEVAGDPAADFSAGTAGRQGLKNRLLRPLHKIAYVWPMKYLCRTTPVSSYVTATSLQKIYPPNPQGFTTHYTTLNLLPEAFTPAPKTEQDFTQQPLNLINVGMMQRLIKGQDLLINAVKTLRTEGHNLTLTLVGAGDQQPLIANLAQEAGIADVTTFTGLLPAGPKVAEVLDAAHLFVMPSRQEGLPRAMIEAMARGLPCIGSDVGGIPELIQPQFIFPSNDEAALTNLIRTFITNPALMAKAAAHNHQAANHYAYPQVRARRQACYTALKNLV